MGTSGNVDTYTINYTDNTTSTFTVTNGVDGQGTNQTLSIQGDQLSISGGNTVTLPTGGAGSGTPGRGIQEITGPVTSGLVDTYTIHYTDGTTSVFTVTNGAPGANGTNGANGQDGQDGQNGQDGQDGRGIQNITGPVTNGLNDTYTINYTDGTTSTFTVKNGAQGPQGLQGLQGPQGLPGTDAPIPQFSYSMNADNTVMTITVTVGNDMQQWQIPVGAGGSTAAQVNADWNATSGVAEILNKPDIAGMQQQIDSLQNLMNNLQNTINVIDAATFQCGTSKVKDYDGNQYNTVKIGTQCWMQENLRTTHYSDGTAIPAGVSGTPDSIARYYLPNNDVNKVQKFGLLYNWYAASNSRNTSYGFSCGQGACPVGWHVPSEAEWYQLRDYVGSQPQYRCGTDSVNVAKALASTTDWFSSDATCAVGNNQAANNATGFNALPAGEGVYYYNSNQNNTYSYFNNGTALFCDNHSYMRIRYSDSTMRNFGASPRLAYSVRCLRDSENEVSNNVNLHDSLATVAFTGNYNDLNGVPTNVSAFQNDAGYITAQNLPIVNDATLTITQDGQTVGTFTANAGNDQTINITSPVVPDITGLQSQIDSLRNAISNAQAQGDDTTYICGLQTVRDYDGNVYNTVRIGNQCWTKENLRSEHYSDGTAIALGSDTSASVAYRYYPDDNAANVPAYGYLYNWSAVIYDDEGQTVNAQGICPTGWHVPSNTEYDTLINYVKSRSEYVCGNTSNYILKALSSQTGWVQYDYLNDPCSPHFNSAANNATGFSLMPAGYIQGSNEILAFGGGAILWSVRNGYINQWPHRTNGNMLWAGGGKPGDYYKKSAFSVRCLRDSYTVSSLQDLYDNLDRRQSDWAETDQNSSAYILNKPDITAMQNQIDSLATVAFTGNYSDLNGTPNIPTVNDATLTIQQDGQTLGTFTANQGTNQTIDITSPVVPDITGLQNQIDSLRNAINNALAQGDDTVFICGVQTVTDYDGNVYNTVRIGNQCWTKENLRSTHYSDGTAIPVGTSHSTTDAYRYYPGNDSANVSVYGYLYNWPAAIHNGTLFPVQGVCPAGWHVPNTTEWTQLFDYAKARSEYKCGNDNEHISKAFASQTGWIAPYPYDSCDVAEYPESNNATGFSALPAGWFPPATNAPSSVGQDTYFATYTGTGNSPISFYRWFPHMSWSSVRFTLSGGSNSFTKASAVSVRCLRDNYTVSSLQEMFDNLNQRQSDWAETNINSAAYILNKPDIAAMQHQIDSLQNLIDFLRDMVIDINDNTFQCGTSKMVDADGNQYETVQIGNQCWTKTNLRVAVGTRQNVYSNTAPYYSVDTTLDVATSGYFYNWLAAQLACPNGWRLPTQGDFQIMMDFVEAQTTRNCYAPALASSTGWATPQSTNSCYPSGNPTANNASGFGAMPIGYRSLSSGSATVENNGEYAEFWTSTEATSTASKVWFIKNNSGYASFTNYVRQAAIPVRCMREVPAEEASINLHDSLATVAFTGNYSDLNGAPTVCDATLTIQQDGQTLGTFTANSCDNQTINITTPTGLTAADVQAMINSAVTPLTQRIDSLQNELDNAQAGTGTGGNNDLTFVCGTSKLYDADGNAYNTVKIGNQCWMKENLRTTKFADGTPIVRVPTQANNDSNYFVGNFPAYYISQYSDAEYQVYNLAAALNGLSAALTNNEATTGADGNGNGYVQGICPDGWHLPSYWGDGGWYQLRNTLTGNSAYTCGNNDYFIAKALADNQTSSWLSSTNECSVGNDIASNNTTGFSAIGVPVCWGYSTDHNGVGGLDRRIDTYFWSSSLQYEWGPTQVPTAVTGAYTFGFRYTDVSIDETNYVKSKNYMLPVRCVRDEAEGTLGQMQQTIDDLQNQNNNLQQTVNQLQQQAQENQNNDDPTFRCGTSKMYDIDGNEYTTVKIGNQCWMKENLRTTRYADGGTIYKGGINDSSATYGYRYSPTNDDANVSIYGYQYNKAAVMHGASSSATSASNVQGVCPENWHMPSNAEWEEMLNAVSNTSQYYCGSSTSNTQYYFYGIAKALAAQNYWDYSNSSCSPGYNSYNNNATGFSALPASFHSKYTNSATGKEAYFWSSTTSGTQTNYYVMRWCDNFVHRSSPTSSSIASGYSVRCVRDAAEGMVYQMQETIDSLQNQINQQQGSLPTATVSLVSMDYNKATVKVTVNGQGEALLVKGVCWVTGSSTPTINNNYKTSDTAANTFYVTITGLSVTGTYSVRAFATSIHGTAYSNQISIQMKQTVPPTGSRTYTLSADSVWVYDAGGPNGNYDNNWNGYLVIKPSASNKRVKLASGTYALEGNSNWDYLEVYDGTQTTATSGYQEHYYASSGSVTAYSSTTSDGALTIRFRSDGSNVRSGFALKFVLEDAPCGRGVTTVSDYQGNSYTIKEFGSQCWMTQNLRARYYSDGTAIAQGPESTAVANTTPYYYYPNGVNSTANINSYGLLYNWKAVVRNSSPSATNPSGVQGPCPSGWHVPSNAEIVQFMQYIQSHSEYACGSSSYAKALSSTYGWTSSTSSCYPGNDQTANNASGFNLPPAGYLYSGETNNYRYYGNQAFIWSCTQYNSSYQSYILRIFGNTVYYGNNATSGSWMEPCSIRCVKN